MPVFLPSEQSNIPLDLPQGEAAFKAQFRASVSVTIVGTTLTIPGTGRYKVLPPSGTSGQINTITLSGENVEGVWIQLRPETSGHTIVIPHAGNIHLLNGISTISLTTPLSTVCFRHHGAGVWAQEGVVNFVP